MISLSLVLVIFLVLEHLIFFFVFLVKKSYNIPIAVLRFAGNKERPTLFVTKGKKVFSGGVPRLVVKGYKIPFRDYLSENYYPAINSKFGGLVLWEFEDGLLTPVIPRKDERKLTKEQKAEINIILKKLNSFTKVGFSYDKFLHYELKLKAVDDVDTEFSLQEYLRVDGQYAGGWRDFLTKHAGAIVIIVVAVCLMVGFIVWLQKAPEFAKECFGASQQAVQEGYLKYLSNLSRPPA